jgi:hypothetical protein
MVAPLLNFSTVQWQVLMHFFLWSKDIKTSEIYRRMLVQYGEHCITQKDVYEIQHGMKILSDEEC